MNEQQQHRPALTYYHANAKGSGCAVSFELHPAHDKTPGSIFACFANQKTTGNRSQGSFPTFDWKNKICVKLSLGDLSQMLQVFRGMCENVGEGKGMFHRSSNANAIIKLEHRLEPMPGYLFEAWRKSIDDNDGQRAHIFFSPTEALGLSLAIEQSIGVIAFGIPTVIPRGESPAADEPEELPF